MYRIILYYNFTKIQNVEDFIEQHKIKCHALGLKGRVYISGEGINGTLAGEPDLIAQYEDYLKSLKGFENTAFKADGSDYVPFAKLIVKERPEIVSLKVSDELDPRNGGRHLSPAEWRNILENEDDFVLIDVRNNYESRIGHFEGALLPDVKNFYNFPDWLERTNIDKEKKVLMYCTGGIRCEKFSVLMKQEGWNDVNQLHGGILEYGKQEGGAHYKGKCFVFDDRLAVPVNPDDEEPISYCEITGTPCDMYINCANMECNRLFICSPEGSEKMEGCCSEECKAHPRRRPFNREKAYAPFRKWYHYFNPDFKDKKVNF
ncbi:MAG: rhodanese-related sulfurtransferase [Balneolales bacterium]